MQILSKFSSLIFVCLITFLFTGCHLFDSTKVSSQEIAAASKWSSADIGPSFDSCDTLEVDEMKNCFREIVSTTIEEYLSSIIFEANNSVQEELLVLIQVDQEGYFSLVEVDFSSALVEAIPNIENILSDAINQLPQAKPAIKSNVGSFVVSQFQLPIRILAQESY